ncbi:PTS sugar transporter subunit IIB [Propionibacterium freudenreichii]|uniref:PTS system, Lactose/Cellobiose specific IIB subunit n=1 Tax=Propionibacterium freudenreichii subsp. freudenreichii TaxID=66712 RepID=A0A0B7NYH3_PROFF|nr:PTS sugar transporter subunit IIB [Propionibacterium freudenreichii]CEP25668.1 PTS system, Lactose/Cellobiose specific IIB subunit [Propionibacterium freudenreichii subsp. freudenreichii]MCT2978779.1 PTS galactitol transporter subunit IIB [Propionibacterium freudenreichii]MCT2984082.1 PTS galactitol transporter subunit IIB [Propionibacterium freudenreichii]MCT2986107.1 PTS galactitol transporter subunit IIB [Propionibacterium freudenreichii]MCT2990120.1 PTS galactitol transporter subunit II
MSELKILIACGSGIATSTVAQEKVKDILANAGIPAKITKGTIGQVESLQDGVDVIMVTTRYQKPLRKPIVSVFGLISGIDQEAVEKEVVDVSRAALAAKD